MCVGATTRVFSEGERHRKRERRIAAVRDCRLRGWPYARRACSSPVAQTIRDIVVVVSDRNAKAISFQRTSMSDHDDRAKGTEGRCISRRDGCRVLRKRDTPVLVSEIGYRRFQTCQKQVTNWQEVDYEIILQQDLRPLGWRPWGVDRVTCLQ